MERMSSIGSETFWSDRAEKMWKDMYENHRSEKMRERFPGRASYESTFKKSFSSKYARRAYLTKEEKAERARDRARRVNEAQKHKKEWREWENLQKRWVRSATLRRKTARIDSFLAKKGRELLTKRQDAQRKRHASRLDEDKDRHLKTTRALRDSIEEKQRRAQERLKAYREERELALATARYRTELRSEDARQRLRAEQYKRDRNHDDLARKQERAAMSKSILTQKRRGSTTF